MFIIRWGKIDCVNRIFYLFGSKPTCKKWFIFFEISTIYFVLYSLAFQIFFLCWFYPFKVCVCSIDVFWNEMKRLILVRWKRTEFKPYTGDSTTENPQLFHAFGSFFLTILNGWLAPMLTFNIRYSVAAVDCLTFSIWVLDVSLAFYLEIRWITMNCKQH